MKRRPPPKRRSDKPPTPKPQQQRDDVAPPMYSAPGHMGGNFEDAGYNHAGRGMFGFQQDTLQ